MSTGLKLVCKECGTAVYIGTLNTRVVKDPVKVGHFLWKHSDHELYYLIENDYADYYYDVKMETDAVLNQRILSDGAIIDYNEDA